MIRDTASLSDARVSLPIGEWTVRPEDPGRWLWGATLLFFVVGDALTTTFGIRFGAVEANPFPAYLLAFAGSEFGILVIILAWKAILLAAFAGLYRILPRPHAYGIPIGLAALGLFAVVWNTAIIGILVM